jgi:uncharacterized membrane protein
MMRFFRRKTLSKLWSDLRLFVLYQIMTLIYAFLICVVFILAILLKIGMIVWLIYIIWLAYSVIFVIFSKLFFSKTGWANDCACDKDIVIIGVCDVLLSTLLILLINIH